MRWTTPVAMLAALAVLAGCARPMAEVAEEPVVIEEEPVAASPVFEPECVPGDDDGIGGTGCKLD